MKDFNSLITRQEAFTIIDGQYFRFDKFRYYMDKSLRDQAKYNEQWHDKFDLDEGGLS